MDSLDSILSRVLQNASEKVAQRVQPALNRRPLRDPENPAAVLQSVSTALANIRSPETASAMSQQARRYTSIDPSEYQSSAGDYTGSDSGTSPSLADSHRKTTLADDASTLGTMGSTGAAIIQQISAAGKAFSGIPEAASSFQDAIAEMADSANAAAPAIDSVSGPLSKMAGAIVSHISGMGSKNSQAIGSSAESMADGSGTVRRMLKAPKSFASWFGGDGSDSAEKKSGSAQQWLNSSSIVDSIREMVNNVSQSMGKLQSNTTGLLNGGLSASRFSGGIGGAAGGGDSSSLSGRIGDSFDRILAKSFLMFRGMSPAASGSSGGGDGGSGMFRGIRNQIRGRIGSAGRRMITKYFRNNVMRGRRLLRGAAGGGGGFAAGGVPAGGGAGGIAGAARGIGGAAGAGGGMAGGAAGGGGAAGAAGAGGAVAGGLVLGALALVAVIGLAVAGLMKLGKQGYETALRVAHLDGGLTAAKAQLDVNRLMRDIQTAQTLSPAGAGFMDSLNNLEDALRPITDGAMKSGLEVLAFVTNGVADAFRGVIGASAGLVNSLNEIDKKLGKDWIPDDLAQKMEAFAEGPKQKQNLEAAPLHNMFLNMPLAAPPRPLIPPIGQNGNGNGN